MPVSSWNIAQELVHRNRVAFVGQARQLTPSPECWSSYNLDIISASPDGCTFEHSLHSPKIDFYLRRVVLESGSQTNAS